MQEAILTALQRALEALPIQQPVRLITETMNSIITQCNSAVLVSIKAGEIQSALQDANTEPDEAICAMLGTEVLKSLKSTTSQKAFSPE